MYTQRDFSIHMYAGLYSVCATPVVDTSIPYHCLLETSFAQYIHIMLICQKLNFDKVERREGRLEQPNVNELHVQSYIRLQLNVLLAMFVKCRDQGEAQMRLCDSTVANRITAISIA